MPRCVGFFPNGCRCTFDALPGNYKKCGHHRGAKQVKKSKKIVKKRVPVKADLLNVLTKISLQNICDDLELPITGNKDDLIESIKKDSTSIPNRILRKLNKDSLQSICEDIDINISGNKHELVDRILEAL